jgi:hypothetical protein
MRILVGSSESRNVREYRPLNNDGGPVGPSGMTSAKADVTWADDGPSGSTAQQQQQQRRRRRRRIPTRGWQWGTAKAEVRARVRLNRRRKNVGVETSPDIAAGPWRLENVAVF